MDNAAHERHSAAILLGFGKRTTDLCRYRAARLYSSAAKGALFSVPQRSLSAFRWQTVERAEAQGET